MSLYSQTPEQVEAAGSVQPLDACGNLRQRAARAVLRFSRLGAEIRRLGLWLESEALPAARKDHRERFHLHVVGQGETPDPGLVAQGASAALGEYPRLCAFLAGLGIRRAALDPRLECNQVSDVLALLWAFRRGLEARREGAPRGIAAALLGEAGVQFACARIRIRAGVLEVAYSYCATRFSQLARWFVRHSRHFTDHRALFHVAPRYALLTAVTAVVPLLIYTVYQSRWLLLAVTALVAATLFVLVYLFFMVVGSLEYDNEEKAEHLARAYEKVRRYAGRIQENLARARTVQQQLLPEPARMPLSDRLEWGSSFVPEAEVGGDYFDAAALDADRVAVLFSDVSGHGMSAALVTAIIKCGFEDWLELGGDLAALVVKLNRQLFRLTPEESFAALFLAIYDARSGELRYANCGHNPEPWRIPARPDEPIRSLSAARTTLLGVLEDIPVVQAVERLEPGDTVLFVTDGIIEAREPGGAMFTRRRLEALLEEYRGRAAGELVGGIRRRVQEFIGGADQIDDHTMLAFRVKQAAAVESAGAGRLEYQRARERT